MTVSGAGTRTKLRLTQGESTARSWELVASSAQTTLTIGAGADCNWVIHADGVRARHVSLQWDGGALRAADLGGAGGASIDGEPLSSAWRDVPEHAELHVGRAIISIETSYTVEADAHPLDGFSAAGFGVQRGSQPGNVSSPASFNSGTSARSSSSGSFAPTHVQQPAPTMRKATLVGVAPITAESVTSGRSASSVPPAEGFRVLRPSEAGEKQKRISSAPPAPETPVLLTSPEPVLLGSPSQPAPAYAPSVQYGFPSGGDAAGSRPASATVADSPAASAEVVPEATPPSQASHDAPSPAKIAAMRSGTLIGVAVPEVLQALRSKRTGGASLADDGQRTLHGYVPPPAGTPGAALAPSPVVIARGGTLIQVLDRGGSHASDATQRIGSAWQESPQGDVGSFSGRPSGVLDASAVHAQRPSLASETWPARDLVGDTIDDPPVTNRAPAGGFPWRYIGIAMLTVVAYFAWLYLLDHL